MQNSTIRVCWLRPLRHPKIQGNIFNFMFVNSCAHFFGLLFYFYFLSFFPHFGSSEANLHIIKKFSVEHMHMPKFPECNAALISDLFEQNAQVQRWENEADKSTEVSLQVWWEPGNQQKTNLLQTLHISPCLVIYFFLHPLHLNLGSFTGSQS